MKRLLIALDNLAMSKLDNLANKIIIKFKLEERDRPTFYTEQPKLRTVHPENRLSQEEWFKEYKVSMMYDRQIVYIG